MTRPPFKTEAERQQYLAEVHGAAERAYAALKLGDRIRVTRCGGSAPTFTLDGFVEFNGHRRWMRSRSGIDDLSPYCVIAVNGVPTSFRDDPAAHLANPFDIPTEAQSR